MFLLPLLLKIITLSNGYIDNEFYSINSNWAEESFLNKVSILSHLL